MAGIAGLVSVLFGCEYAVHPSDDSDESHQCSRFVTMFLSVFEMFKVGIGPSSSHTMGPMVAAARFLDLMRASPFEFHGLRAHLHGSLAFTGVGHATDRATILGLAGLRPETYDNEEAETVLEDIRGKGTVTPPGLPSLQFHPKEDLKFDFGPNLPGHANGMILMATDKQGDVILQETYYSVGGGFVLTADELAAGRDTDDGPPVPYPFKSAAEMLEMAETSGKSIADMKKANEISRGGSENLRSGVTRLWQVMNDCIERGLVNDGILPGGLRVRRRSKAIHQALLAERGTNLNAPHKINDWISIYAMSVNEENAAGGQVVTAPTNGAAGVVPAVIKYWLEHVPGANEREISLFFDDDGSEQRGAGDGGRHAVAACDPPGTACGQHPNRDLGCEHHERRHAPPGECRRVDGRQSGDDAENR